MSGRDDHLDCPSRPGSVHEHCDVLVIGGGPAGSTSHNIRDMGPLQGETVIEAR